MLDASKGVSILDGEFEHNQREIAINTDFGAGTKRTLAFDNDMVIVSEGAKGAGVYSALSGSLLEYIPILSDGTSEWRIETNAVATNEEVILMANGGSGLCLSEDKDGDMGRCRCNQLDGSINYVESKG